MCSRSWTRRKAREYDDFDQFSIHSDDFRSNAVAGVFTWNSVELDKESDYRLKLVHGRRRPAGAISNPVLYGISLQMFTMYVTCDIAIVLMGSHLSECYEIDGIHFLYTNAIGWELQYSLTFDSTDKVNTFSDVTLVATPTEDSSNEVPVEFSAHKVILAARSPVFEKMSTKCRKVRTTGLN